MRKLIASMLLTVAMTGVQAAWPEKPVTVLVPFPAGGSTDNVARILSAKFQAEFGGSFVVDNRPGAAGMIGAAIVKRAPADGYT
ncbi:LacI family transcriptional regulator, partial [Pseudomonas sp. GW460-13]